MLSGNPIYEPLKQNDCLLYLPFGADSEVSIATGTTTFRYFLIVTTNNAINQSPPSTDSVAGITLELESASAAKYTKLSKSGLWYFTVVIKEIS